MFKPTSDIASAFLTRFARLMRAVLENARKEEVTLASDLAVMRDYLELEKVRMKGGFEYAIEVEPPIDSEEVMVPPMLLQPFAEEAIWRRLARRDGIGRLTIRVHLYGKALVLSLEDDAFAEEHDAAAAHQDEAGPIVDVDGAAITRARLEVLTKQETSAASVHVVPLAGGRQWS
ncbi:MAG: histidine kinase [Flavobacteriales bacterium]|nr:histidine kinase [Flavobacteriales bacterium]